MTNTLLDYIKDERDDLHVTATIMGQEREVFNQREIDHMKDVKALYQNAMILRNILAVVAVFLLLFMLIKKQNIWTALFVKRAMGTWIVLLLSLIHILHGNVRDRLYSPSEDR